MSRSTSTKASICVGAAIGLAAGMVAFTPVSAAAVPIVVNSLSDTTAAGDGSCTLREAVANASADTDMTVGDCAAGSGAETVTFSVAGTIVLTEGSLVLGGAVTIDGTTSAGIVISGDHSHRVVVVNAGESATVRALTIRDGYGWMLAGGVLDNGNLTLDRVTVTGNTMATDAGDYWQGGGGIYVGGSGSLTLLDSTVSGNHAAWSGGGIYTFSGSTTTIVRSTLSGNISNDTGGAIRSLGDISIVNSTLAGNQATGWHGGAIFHTDAVMTISSSTIAANVAPDWSPSAIFIGSYSPGVVAKLDMQNTIVTGNNWYACEQYSSSGTVSLTSGGYNVVQDTSCNPVSSDVVVWDAGLGPLADNGGLTRTMALLPGSVAIDAVPAGVNGCGTTIATDQRGWGRPVGSGCDVGAFELGARPAYAFTGFLAPVDNAPTVNKVKAGAAVPVRFSLDGDQGLDIFAEGYPTSRAIPCDTGAPADSIEVTTTAGASGLSYDAVTDTYTYVWKTQRSWSRSCRQLVVQLDDATTHVAEFQFN